MLEIAIHEILNLTNHGWYFTSINNILEENLSSRGTIQRIFHQCLFGATVIQDILSCMCLCRCVFVCVCFSVGECLCKCRSVSVCVWVCVYACSV